MKIIIASYRFNPSHLSHIVAMTSVYHDRGYKVYHRVDKKYLILHSGDDLKYISFKNFLKINKEDIFIVYAPSLKALIESCVIKIYTKPFLVYFLHEPFTGFRSYMNAGFSFLKVMRIAAIAVVSYLNHKLSDIVVLSSAKAYQAVTSRKDNLEKYKKVNLFFMDESECFRNFSPLRKYISYIGTVAEDHAFNEFVDLVYESVISQCLTDEKFLIATKSAIPKNLYFKINQCIKSGYLTVISDKPMSTIEINSYYASSFVVWNAYKRSMQSGVLPKSYMFGTPVINCDFNLSEYFIDDFHGVSIGSDYNLDAFLSAIHTIKKNFEEFSKNCRNSYLSIFDISSQSVQILSLVEGNRERSQ